MGIAAGLLTLLLEPGRYGMALIAAIVVANLAAALFFAIRAARKR